MINNNIEILALHYYIQEINLSFPVIILYK